MAFLNNRDSRLNGRPIDIAIASQEGFSRVLDAILERSALQTGD